MVEMIVKLTLLIKICRKGSSLEMSWNMYPHDNANVLGSARHLCDLSILSMRNQNLVTLFVILRKSHNVMIMM